MPGLGHFVPNPGYLRAESSVGNILDKLTFANNLKKMAKKDVKEEINETTGTEVDINADESLSGTTHLNEPVADEPALEKAKEELNEARDKYLRLAAEFDNFKRRNAKERIELIQTAGRDVIVDLLEVLDDYDRAQQQLENSEDIQIKEGMSLIFNKLKTKLQARGLKPMETIGKDFNADLHEAITEIPAASDELKGKVVDEVGKGYYLNDKLIRYAKVVVGK